MLEGRQALNLAIDFARMPTLAETLRMQPLPSDTLVIIRIAAGCEETSRAAERATGLPYALIREACILYLQRILFAPNADSHRVLGVPPGAPRAVIREHLRWLLKWLHPDANRSEWDSVFADRILKAWRDAGSKKRESRNDRGREIAVLRPPRLGQRRKRHQGRHVQRWVEMPLIPAPTDTPARRRRSVMMSAAVVLGSAIVLAFAFLPFPGALSSLAWTDMQRPGLSADQ